MKAIWRIVVGAVASVVFVSIARFARWDQHPGSEAKFVRELPWYCLGGLLLAGIVFLAIFYVREYWELFFGASEEEHNGI